MTERRRSDNAPTRALLTEFDRLHQAHVGYPAVIHGGKDAKLIAGIWKSHGEPLVKELMADFFASRDPFIRQNGYTVGMFLSQAGKLLAHRAAPVRPRTLGPERRPDPWEVECHDAHDCACGGETSHAERMAREKAVAS